MKGGTKMPKSRQLHYAGGVVVKAGTTNALHAKRAGAWSPETGFVNQDPRTGNWNTKTASASMSR